MLDFSKKTPIIFEYKMCHIKSVNGQLEEVYRPLAIIKVGKKNFSMTALIDTGSDKTISYLDPFGKQLGVDIDDYEGEPPSELRGLNGISKAWPKHMDVWIGDHYFNLNIFWITDEYNIEKEYNMILGRNLIFNHFDVVFVESEKKVYFYAKDNR